MHILINAASAQMGGAVTYLQNVLRWFPEVAPDDQCTVYLPAATRAKFEEHPAFAETPNLRFETYPYAESGGAARLYFDQVAIPRLVRRHGIDVLFSSTGFGTVFPACPQVLLVRNPVYFNKDFHARYRQLGRSLQRNTLRRWHSLLSIRSADIVMFPTRAMQDMVAQYIPLHGKRTEAIHYGFEHSAFSQNGTALSDVEAAVRRWKAEGYAILLSVSTYAVHKNFEVLIEALPHLKANGTRVKLLATVSRDRTADKAEYDALLQRARELGVEDGFVELGYVPYQQLGPLYREADLYVFPSFTESFGHSMVEAMAAGLPVVAAGTPVNQEVCGAAGFYFRTFDPVDCADKITAVVQDAGQRARYAEASVARSKDFSWRRYAEQLIALCRDAAYPS